MENIGTRIRKIRHQQHRTMQEIAETCGFTKGLLSKIESGKCRPTIATLTKIAKTLGVSAAALLEENVTDATAFTAAKTVHAAEWPRTDKGYAYYAFAAGRTNKLMQPFLMTAEKGQVKPQGLSHDGDEFIYVLDGEMEYRVGNQVYRMGPGDSVYFDAIETHELTPISERVTYLAIFTLPRVDEE